METRAKGWKIDKEGWHYRRLNKRETGLASLYFRAKSNGLVSETEGKATTVQLDVPKLTATSPAATADSPGLARKAGGVGPLVENMNHDRPLTQGATRVAETNKSGILRNLNLHIS